MKILVTGACGFIGTHLGNRLLELGHEVVGVDDLGHQSPIAKDFKIVPMDYRQYIVDEPLDDFDAIFHLAAYINVDESIRNPEHYMRNNADGTLRFLEVLREIDFKGRFIFASSAEVYGTARQETMDEDHPLDPLSPYAFSKLAAEQACKVYAQLYHLDITVVRNFNTFGEGQSDGLYGGVIAKFKRQARAGGPLTVYGSGEQARDYMHISQAVAGYVLALERKLPTIVNFGSGVPIKIIDIANFISEKFDVDIDHLPARPNEIARLRADISRARQYGYEVQTDFWRNLDDYLDA